MSLYTESRRYYTEAPKIIQSRGSSSDSRSSYDSRRSTEERHYPSSKSSTGYYGGSQSKVMEVPKERTYRAPDAEEKRISSTTRGKVEVIQQRQRIYEPEAPHSSDATSSHYKDAQRHGSNRHSSSHKHSSHRR